MEKRRLRKGQKHNANTELYRLSTEILEMMIGYLEPLDTLCLSRVC
jgi:23S rRNA maturation mini-RNase III